MYVVVFSFVFCCCWIMFPSVWVCACVCVVVLLLLVFVKWIFPWECEFWRWSLFSRPRSTFVVSFCFVLISLLLLLQSVVVFSCLTIIVIATAARTVTRIFFCFTVVPTAARTFFCFTFVATAALTFFCFTVVPTAARTFFCFTLTVVLTVACALFEFYCVVETVTSTFFQKYDASLLTYSRVFVWTVLSWLFCTCMQSPILVLSFTVPVVLRIVNRLYDLCVLLSLLFYVQSLVRSSCFPLLFFKRTVACTIFALYWFIFYFYVQSLVRSLCFTITVVLRTVPCTIFVF